ncbi:SH3 domain-containing protein [Litoribrevibacter albus]|uniref:SH3b domain-containing protein n=1 Tax=Litoribrevibacter albus TaxID=1473156 RepID=A0AA37S862_9GAMM|nr:SH3 domain-containing protein [Litoribrevibacter albus]GLQ30046.1 hypothetical protein GCM10007876_05240 [Litoribrevibacter albus]
MAQPLRFLIFLIGCVCSAALNAETLDPASQSSVSTTQTLVESTLDEPIQSDRVLLKVEGTFVDLYTGPGYGYPKHYSAKQGEILEVVRRRTSWYRVVTDNGTEGWVEEEQLSSLELVYGDGKDFEEAVLEDFYDARFEISVFVGGLAQDTQFNGRLGYKISEFLEAEAFYGQAFNDFADTRFYGIGIQGKPLRGRRWEPYFGLSMGELENDPNSTVIGGQTTTDEITMAQIGMRFYFTRNFVLRAEFGRMLLHVDDDRRDDLDLVSVGIGAFF